MCVCSLIYPACNGHAPCCVVICGLSACTTFFFFTLSHTGTISEKKKGIEHKKCDLISSTILSETLIIPTRIQRYVITKVQYIGIHVKCPLFLSDFNKTWIPSIDLRKMPKYEVSWKSFDWEPSCSMRTDGQTDMSVLIVALRNFGDAPKNCEYNWGRHNSPSSWASILRRVKQDKVNSVLYWDHKCLKLFIEKFIVQNVGTPNKILKNL